MPDIVGSSKCCLCGNEVDIKCNKNNKIYYFCDCGANIRFGGSDSKKCLSTLARGEAFGEIKPLNYVEKQQIEKKESVKNGKERDTTGQWGRAEESGENQSGDDDDEYF